MAKRHSLHAIINELVDRTNTDTQRIRRLEQREESITSRLDNIDQDILNLNKTILDMDKRIVEGFKKRDADILKIQTNMKEIIKQLKRFATVERLGELESMIDIYNPLKSNFMTKEQVERMLSRQRKS